MYVSIPGQWFTSTGRIEKHTTDDKGKLIKEFIGATKTKEDADRIVGLLNYAEEASKDDNN